MNTRNQDIVYIGSSEEKQREVNSFVGDDSANKNLMRFSDSNEYGHGEVLGVDAFEHVGTNQGKYKKSPPKKELQKTKPAKKKTGFASFMDEIPDRDNSEQDDEWAT